MTDTSRKLVPCKEEVYDYTLLRELMDDIARILDIDSEARLALESEDAWGDPTCEMYLKYKRPETDNEMEIRLRAESRKQQQKERDRIRAEERKAKQQAEKEVQERKQYEKLKAKFEGKRSYD